MGCQGEIYNVLGVKVPAKKEGKGDHEMIYSINGVTCGGEDDYVDLYNGVPTNFYGAAKLNGDLSLVTRILGHDSQMGDRHFKGEALVGVAMCNEAYINGAQELPSQDDIDKAKPKVIKLLKEKLGLDVEENDLKMFLLFDSLNGW